MCAAKHQLFTLPHNPALISSISFLAQVCTSSILNVYIIPSTPASLYKPAEVRMELAPVASLTTTRLHKFSACNINQVVQTLVQLVTTGTKYPCIDMNDLCHNNTIYSIVTLLSITCLSSSTLSWSSERSSQYNDHGDEDRPPGAGVVGQQHQHVEGEVADWLLT